MNPCKYADIVTTTTHKTLRGPRGGLILGKQEYEKAVNKAIFPGIQGGPLQHIIASKAVCFKEAMSDGFKKYQEQVVKNAKALAKHFMDKGYNVITGGTDNHLILINLANKNITGKEAQDKLDLANITLNKNSVPFDTQNFIKTGGVRIGSPAVTTRGMVEEDMKLIVDAIDLVISEDKNEEAKAIVKSLTDKYPLYKDIVM
jgi:glycine hydroxymethyltransferase